MLCFLFLIATKNIKAQNFDDMARLTPSSERTWDIHGYQRIRFNNLYNFDLDHGFTPSQQPLFPIPLDEGQMFSNADMRLRLDVSGVSQRGSVGVNVRIDALDNMRMGAFPNDTPIDTTSQHAPSDSLIVRRAYITALTPVGYLIAGRMGNDWGLGMVANSGDCLDCNTVDVADRVLFLTSLVGHLWILSYDYAATGSGIQRPDNRPELDMTTRDNAHGWTGAVLKIYSDLSLQRRKKANRWSFEYGAYTSSRSQIWDIPTSYLDSGVDIEITPDSLIPRNYRATVLDGWFRLSGPYQRLEMEFAYLNGTIGSTSLIPHIQSDDPLKSQQYGVVVESDVLIGQNRRFGIGLDGGLASGDPMPGFGSNVNFLDTPPQGGDLNGPQFELGNDMQVDNFSMHSDYQIDKILWREIIGHVTDAMYIRPHIESKILDTGPGSLYMEQAVIASMSMFGTSTPSGQRPLGIEWNPSIEYLSTDGLNLRFDYALLIPLSGLDNSIAGISSRPAQLFRTHVRYLF